MEDEINYNLAYKWFVGLDLDEKAPDHCIFSANRRRRFSSKIFEDILEEIVRRCIELKLVDGRILLTDSTHIKDNVNKENQEKIFVTETPSAYMQKLDKEALNQGLVDEIPEYISEIITDEAELSELKEADKIDEEINKKIKKKRKKNSKTVVRNGKNVRVKKVPKNQSDPDSGLLFRDKKPRIFGYLSHNTVDSKNGITLAVTVTPANVSDNVPHAKQIIEILDKYKFDTYAIAADSGYDSSEIYSEMYKHGIKCFIIPQKRSGADVLRYEILNTTRFWTAIFALKGRKLNLKVLLSERDTRNIPLTGKNVKNALANRVVYIKVFHLVCTKESDENSKNLSVLTSGEMRFGFGKFCARATLRVKKSRTI